MIVMFVIAATTSVGATAVMIIADLCIVDAKHRLRGDLLHKRDRSQDWSARAARWLAQVPFVPLPMTLITPYCCRHLKYDICHG